MTKLYLFGDSWAEENGEYEEIYQAGKAKEIPRSLGKLISELCELEYSCHAKGGSSQFGIFMQLLNSDIQPGDVAIFVLTSPSRRTYFDDKGNSTTVMVDLRPEYVSDYQDSWLSAVFCFSMLQYCISKGIKPLFVNTFNIGYIELCPLWNSIPDEYWILPADTCVVRELYDPEWFKQYENYRNSDFAEWLDADPKSVSVYIRPCIVHPNMEGRRAMANAISTAVKKILT